MGNHTSMDKLQLTGRNLGRVFNFRSGHLHAVHLWCYTLKLPNLKLNTQPKQFLGSLLLDIALHDTSAFISEVKSFIRQTLVQNWKPINQFQSGAKVTKLFCRPVSDE